MAKLKLAEADEDRDHAAEEAQPKRRPIPDHVPRNEIEITPTTGARRSCRRGVLNVPART